MNLYVRMLRYGKKIELEIRKQYCKFLRVVYSAHWEEIVNNHKTFKGSNKLQVRNYRMCCNVYAFLPFLAVKFKDCTVIGQCLMI